jgi:hypothetical protein
MRRGVAVVALIGGFVAATTLPAAAQYVGVSDWNGGAGVSVGIGSPGVYGAYEMVLAHGLGDEGRQASRDEEGDRGAGASLGRDHAPHVG